MLSPVTDCCITPALRSPSIDRRRWFSLSLVFYPLKTLRAKAGSSFLPVFISKVGVVVYDFHADPQQIQGCRSRSLSLSSPQLHSFSASKNSAVSRKFRRGAKHGSFRIHCKYWKLKLAVAFIETSCLILFSSLGILSYYMQQIQLFVWCHQLLLTDPYNLLHCGCSVQYRLGIY